jgi:hypothetical protein
MPAASASMPMPSYGNCVLSVFVTTGCFEEWGGGGGGGQGARTIPLPHQTVSEIIIKFRRLCLPVPEFLDPVFTKTSPKRSFSLNRKRAFWLVFAKTGSIISGTDIHKNRTFYGSIVQESEVWS